MTKWLPLLALIWVVGCSTLTAPPSSPKIVLRDETPHPAMAETVVRALSFLGTPYRFGGQSPEAGFDCSGLVWFVYREALGINLPRTTRGLSEALGPAPHQSARAGDLVFFNTLKTAYSHVGIYLGDGRFIHAPATGGFVRIESLHTPYWQSRFDGVRRVNVAKLPRSFGHSSAY